MDDKSTYLDHLTARFAAQELAIFEAFISIEMGSASVDLSSTNFNEWAAQMHSATLLDLLVTTAYCFYLKSFQINNNFAYPRWLIFINLLLYYSMLN